MGNKKKTTDNNKKDFQWKRVGKTSFTWIAIILVTVYFSSILSESRNNEVEIDYTEYRHYLNDGLIHKAVIINNTFHGEFKSPQTIDTPLGVRDDIEKFRLTMPFIDRELTEKWDAAGLDYSFKEKSIDWTGYFLNMLPWVLLIGFWFFMLKRMQGGAGGMGGIFKFGKSKASLWTSDQPRVTLKDVAGCDEAKEELSEVIDFLKSPKRFQKLGAKVPRGALLVGQPGTGKTLLARAIAGEASVPFYSLSGADFVEMFVGVGASRVRDLFEQAKKSTPCIIFIDELDAVGRQRGAGIGGGHDEREQTLNALLVEMDGFDNNQNIIVIAATNRPDVLDSALLRPGRFDRQIIVDPPDYLGRLGILKVHTKKVIINNIPLTEEQLSSNEIIQDGLVGYYTFNSGYGNTLTDQSGSGNHATIHGAQWESDVAFDCTDSYACNYTPSANNNDGSCLYDDCNGECGGEDMDSCKDCNGDMHGYAVVNGCGDCQGGLPGIPFDESWCTGCMDHIALGFDAINIISDPSQCEYPANTITIAADFAVSVYAADLDGDGYMDVLSASEFDDRLAWYKNDGSGNFGSQNTIYYMKILVFASGSRGVHELKTVPFSSKVCTHQTAPAIHCSNLCDLYLWRKVGSPHFIPHRQPSQACKMLQLFVTLEMSWNRS
mgnify:CR=1 FL=1